MYRDLVRSFFTDARRAQPQAELDAWFARAYGLHRKQLRYILDPADLTPRELENILDPWEKVSNPLNPVGSPFQYIVTTTEPPPEAFRRAPWLLNPVLNAAEAKGRFLGVNL